MDPKEGKQRLDSTENATPVEVRKADFDEFTAPDGTRFVRRDIGDRVETLVFYPDAPMTPMIWND